MIHNRSLNDEISHVHERALRIVYDDYISSFEYLLSKDEYVTIHQRDLFYSKNRNRFDNYE